MKDNTYKSEAGHWYDRAGEPMYTIIGANGKERNTNLRDAKSLGLVPSVTTVSYTHLTLPTIYSV